MKKLLVVLLALIMVFTLVGCGEKEPAAEDQQPQDDSPYAITKPIDLILGSAGSGNADFAEIGTICNFLNTAGIFPEGSKITQETVTSGASTAGYIIEAGLCDMARGQNALAATVGLQDRAPYSSVCALMACGSNSCCVELCTEAFQKKSGCTTLEDVCEKKYKATICTEGVGSGDYALLEYILSYYDYTVEDLEGWGAKLITTDNNTASEMLQDGQADLMVMGTTFTSSMVTELMMTTPVIINAITPKVVDYLLTKGYAERIIPAGTFDNQFTEDTRTAYIGTSLIVSKDLDVAVAYQLTKALYENRDKLGEDCATMRGITPDMVTDEKITVVPLHEGAIAYYKEVGIL